MASERTPPQSYKPIDVARNFIPALSSADRRAFLQNMDALMFNSKPFAIGTACSGTDAVISWWHDLERATIELLDSTVARQPHAVHVFSCESHEATRMFIHDNCKPGALFHDVKHLSSSAEVHDDMTGASRLVPAVDFFICGFSCKSVSFKNSRRTEFGKELLREMLCRFSLGADSGLDVNRATDTTSYTLSGVLDFVKERRPSLILLENVMGFAPFVPELAKIMRNFGYMFITMTVDAGEYSTAARRQRIFMVCVSRDIDVAGKEEDLENKIKDTLQKLQCQRLPIDAFIAEGDVALERAIDAAIDTRGAFDANSALDTSSRALDGSAVVPALKKARVIDSQNHKWVELHKKIFGRMSLPFAIPKARADLAIRGLSPREQSIIEFLDYTAEHSDTGDGEIFVDIDQNIDRIHRSPIVPTLCDRSKIYMQKQRALLPSLAHLRLQHIDVDKLPALGSVGPSMWRQLAGQAFCGSAVIAVLIAMVAHLDVSKLPGSSSNLPSVPRGLKECQKPDGAWCGVFDDDLQP